MLLLRIPNKQNFTQSIRRKTINSSGLPGKAYKNKSVNLYDLQRTIAFEDNRNGWRRYNLSIQSLFRTSYKFKRDRNGSFDLVGVELNPGPNPNGKKGKGKGKQQQVANNNPKPKPQAQKKKQASPPTAKGSSLYSPAANRYLASVLTPCAGNARVPDYNCMPTGLVTLKQELVLGVSAGGVGGIVTNLCTAPSYNTENLATTTDAVFAFNATTVMSGEVAFTASWQASRLVSACLDIEFLGTTLTDSGLITGVTYGSFNGTAETQAGSLTNLLACRVSDSHRLSKGISVIYRPSDSTSLNFRQNGTFGAFYGALQVHISGAQATATYRATITQNYECIPASDTLSNAMPVGSLQSSPVDPVGHAAAINTMSAVKPIMSLERAENFTNSLSNLINTGRSVWSTVSNFANGVGKNIMSGLAYAKYGKYV